MVWIIGEHPLAKNEKGELYSRIATVFPHGNAVVTLPGIHATQRIAYLEALNAKRAAEGCRPLSEQEENDELESGVDLIMEGDNILIRPDPDNMGLAFMAEELLQTFVPKYQIKFLFVLDARVREAIKKQGECWRISPLPRSQGEMKQMVEMSKIGIGGLEIYYYNKATGTRWLTYENFSELGNLDDGELRKHLVEIKTYASVGNRRGTAEIAFFMADQNFAAESFARYSLPSLDGQSLRNAFEELRVAFREAVKPEFRHDDVNNPEWRRAMFSTLVAQVNEVLPEETLLGLSPEFFMQIEWLPGGRIEDGELIFDPIFDEDGKGGNSEEIAHLRDEKARGFIFNFIREYGDLEYVNIGRVTHSLSHRPTALGRRDVYIAEIKQRGYRKEIVHIIRMQKWGMREHLDEGKNLLEALVESEEYTEYILDRRLGCRQLGMHLPSWITAKRISERYNGSQKSLNGISIWSPYFERDYIAGVATDKMAGARLENEVYALRFAQLLGMTAAPNLIVGRVDLVGKVIFDDGDEVMVEDPDGMPMGIVVADHTGTFNDYRTDLANFAATYAGPVNRRIHHVANPKAFSQVYVDAFEERFVAIQNEYRKRQRAFDTLFKHRPRHEGGSFAYRWEQVLARLNRTDAKEVAELIRKNMVVI